MVGHLIITTQPEARHGRLASSLLAIVIILLMAGASWRAQCAKGGPRISFKETAFDFGYRLPQKTVTLKHEFIFRNSGCRELRILKVGSACRTQASCSRICIKPGKSSSVLVTVILPEAYATSDQFTRAIQISSNDPTQPEIELSVRASFRYTLNWDPHEMDLGLDASSQRAARQITISSGMPEPFKILSCTANPKYFQVIMKPGATNAAALPMGFIKADKTGYHAKSIRLAMNPEAPAGRFFETLNIRTDRKDIPLITIPVSGEIAGELAISPRGLFFGIIRSSHIVEREIELVSGSPGTLFLSVSCLIPGLKAVIQAGGRRIQLILDPRRCPEILEGDITIRTNAASAPELKVAVEGLIKLAAVQGGNIR